ncbi:hypothetical protein PoB_000682100 [Plakobranchus ocellatus]|uniref:Uncharacterized protein n=1 Tax=Plakobranchus ocellatus TaxID=259542 RepID=A0AAV3XZD9_9GAST|nr:hypothetical protein PoB_000682100 [Plakobranchus ocellatus]
MKVVKGLSEADCCGRQNCDRRCHFGQAPCLKGLASSFVRPPWNTPKNSKSRPYFLCRLVRASRLRAGSPTTDGGEGKGDNPQPHAIQGRSESVLRSLDLTPPSHAWSLSSSS